MGFTVYYRSARPVGAAEADAIRRAARRANAGRTWLGCEPVHFFEGEEDGHLLGGSKPNFLPHPDDAAAAGREGLPDGTTRDLLDILCQLSREYGVDWALSHDYEPALGFIRGGVCDARRGTRSARSPTWGTFSASWNWAKRIDGPHVTFPRRAGGIV